ncbi:hypothetical protein [Crassaminicella profunda]|uniref:hypothetical protein n=1 Tax=Crassaminicella profunda TaxID=1286698 RepID=UPI001CA6A588|nr:hypothetical protein [Crassaminicella profunda]QZY53817.1 hypothetical protein K7H06_12210 [Crassaminicella profunda]
MNFKKYFIMCGVFIFLQFVDNDPTNVKFFLAFAIVILLFDMVKYIKMKNREKNVEKFIIKGRVVSKRVDTKNCWESSTNGHVYLGSTYLYVIVIENKNNNRFDIIIKEYKYRHLVGDIYNLGDTLEVYVKKYKDEEYYHRIKE